MQGLHVSDELGFILFEFKCSGYLMSYEMNLVPHNCCTNKPLQDKIQEK